MIEASNRLTPALRKQITRDWQSSFPQLGLYRPMHLMRRTGPILIGVLLQANDSNRTYRAIAHVHNLAREFPTVSLTLAEEVPHEYVKVEWHDAKFRGLAERLRGVSRVPLEGAVRYSVVLKGYWEYIESPKGRFQIPLLEDAIRLAACSGDEALIRETSDHVGSIADAWGEATFSRAGGRAKWMSRLQETAKDRKALLETAEREAHRHKATDLPWEDLPT